MRTTAFFIALVTASTALQQQALIKGCALWDSDRGTCQFCYRRQVASNGCGPLLPPSDTCLLHAESIGQATNCLRCQLGYGKVYHHNNNCGPNNIFNCLQAQIASFTGTRLSCRICGNGQHPTPDHSQCAPLTTGGMPNCLWGLRGGCDRCVPGYASSFSGNYCIPLTPETEGCWTLTDDRSSCYFCDVIAGYSMQKNGKCKFVLNE